MGLVLLVFFKYQKALDTNINIFCKSAHCFAKFYKSPFIGKSLINLNTK